MCVTQYHQRFQILKGLLDSGTIDHINNRSTGAKASVLGGIVTAVRRAPRDALGGVIQGAHFQESCGLCG